jgi:hypothetical protein
MDIIKIASKNDKNSPQKIQEGPKKPEYFCIFGIIFVLFGGFLY